MSRNKLAAAPSAADSASSRIRVVAVAFASRSRALPDSAGWCAGRLRGHSRRRRLAILATILVDHSIQPSGMFVEVKDGSAQLTQDHIDLPRGEGRGVQLSEESFNPLTLFTELG